MITANQLIASTDSSFLTESGIKTKDLIDIQANAEIKSLKLWSNEVKLKTLTDSITLGEIEAINHLTIDSGKDIRGDQRVWPRVYLGWYATRFIAAKGEVDRIPIYR